MAKAASVFKMGPIQQTGVGRGGRERGPFFKQTDVSQQSLYEMCERERESLFCYGKTLGTGAAPHI